MEIGRLSHRIVIANYYENMIPNSSANYKYFEEVYTVWAKIQDNGGTVYFNNAQVGANITHKIFIRYQDYITTENWIIWQGRLFRIRATTDIWERHRWLSLDCEEVGYQVFGFIVGSNAMGDPLGYVQTP